MSPWCTNDQRWPHLNWQLTPCGLIGAVIALALFLPSLPYQLLPGTIRFLTQVPMNTLQP